MRRLVPWLPVLAIAAVLFWASSDPDLRFFRDDVPDTLFRKAGHIAVYGTGTLLAWWALRRTTGLHRAWAWAAGIALGFAASDELHQAFVAGRDATVVDVLVDAVGIAGAVLLGRWWLARRGVDPDAPRPDAPGTTSRPGPAGTRP